MIEANQKAMEGLLGGTVQYRGIIHIIENIEDELEEKSTKGRSIDMRVKSIEDKMLWQKAWIAGAIAIGTLSGGLLVLLIKKLFGL